MNATLLVTGVVCVIAATVGGGLKAAGIEFPIFASIKRQLLLAAFGAALIAISLISPHPDPPVQPHPKVDDVTPSKESTSADLPCLSGPYKPPAFKGQVKKIAFHNDGQIEVTVHLYHPQAPSSPSSSMVIAPGQNLVLAANIGDDWGIQINQGCIEPVGAVAKSYDANWQAAGNNTGLRKVE